ncbi:hypothetical protein, partial [Methanobrevibacter sp.]|uniref:hypothetical protein n=1 Tax=Methanobrevibacter sp. TaxID=66852 RepID=UPI00388F9A49
MQITLNELTVKQQAYLAKTILDNPYIPHDPFFEQCHFLADTTEESFYGGQAGGGKSDALLMGALQYVTDDYIIEDDKREHNPYKALLIR